jgi:hypothetical protein
MRPLTLAVLLALLLPAGAAAKATVPPGFMGISTDIPLAQDASVDQSAQLNSMVASGVQSLRVQFNWSAAQPYAKFADVPLTERTRYSDEGGVPTDWSVTDGTVADAARRRLDLLPVVLSAPSWAARHPGEFSSPPTDPRQYAAFTAALARRYGPRGSFWAAHRELVARPIRHWQLWNEPSMKAFWSDQPFAPDYVALVRASRAEIRRVDPGAKIVLAGLPNKSWVALEKIYKAGGRRQFDVAAFHPFTATVDGVRTILRRDRKVMAHHHDARKPLWVTELSWTSAKGKTKVKFGNEATVRGQAKQLTAAYRMLAKERRKLRLARAFWYTWLSRDKLRTYPFDFAGLLRLEGHKIVRKPAFGAYRRMALKLEGCRAKNGRADRCSR